MAAAAVSSGDKSKVAAILLAVFLAFWSWLYTYREDGVKFWIGFASHTVSLILTVLTGVWVFVWILIGFGFWIWAIIDTAIKSDEWYANYERR